MEQPIACSLDAVRAGERRAAWGRLAVDALCDRRSTANGVQLVFSGGAGVEETLGELVRLERECCAFARWTVSRRDGDLVLDVSADGEGVAAVHELFGAHVASGG